jgi:hypothetical protein
MTSSTLNQPIRFPSERTGCGHPIQRAGARLIWERCVDHRNQSNWFLSLRELPGHLERNQTAKRESA